MIDESTLRDESDGRMYSERLTKIVDFALGMWIIYLFLICVASIWDLFTGVSSDLDMLFILAAVNIGLLGYFCGEPNEDGRTPRNAAALVVSVLIMSLLAFGGGGAATDGGHNGATVTNTTSAPLTPGESYGDEEDDDDDTHVYVPSGDGYDSGGEYGGGDIGVGDGGINIDWI